jgi:DnaJ-class molecular chaperone
MKADIWKCKCDKCGGSGNKTYRNSQGILLAKPCPTCQGSGYMALGVRTECKPCKGRGQFGPTNTAGLYCKFCDDCKGKGWLYRPLTNAEVEELLNEVEISVTGNKSETKELVANSLFMIALDKGLITYKNSLVTLIPYKEG